MGAESPAGKDAATAVRALDAPMHEGCRVLSRVGVNYRDGAELELLHLIRETADLSSLSDELANAATSWAQHYHLSRARANIIRGLDFGNSSNVLEVGAGCGAITRYIGERGLTVDALEPEPARAAVARARTADLANVEVFVGTVDDLPPEQSYDAILVIGVLEWVIGDGHDPSAAARFITSLARRLRPSGWLAIAIENQIGVKYLAGAPEDHSGRAFDGPEGYPLGSPAHTLSRRSLEALLEQCGLSPRFLHAFPDYKMARLVIDDGAFADPTLARFVRDAPPMPSPDRGRAPQRVADEQRLWTTMCEAGLGGSTANSFLILAGRDHSPTTVWPADQAAALFANEDRRKSFATQTCLLKRPDGSWWFERAYMSGGPSERRHGPLSHHITDAPLLPLDHFAHEYPLADLPGWRRGLDAWRTELLRVHSARSAPAEIDLVPHNLLSVGDQVRAIDREWLHDEWTVSDVLARGLTLAISDLATLARRGELHGYGTVREIIADAGSHLGLPVGASWLDAALLRERMLHREVQGRSTLDEPFERATHAWLQAINRNLDAIVDPPGSGSSRRDGLARARRLISTLRSRVRYAR